MSFHRILLLNRNHIGDCLFTTPAIRALRTAFPEAVLVATVPAANHDLLASNPCLSEVLIRPLRGVSEQLRLLREIRRRRFDLVISFQEKSLLYAALARFSGARLTVSLRHWRTQPFYHCSVPPDPEQHEVERYHSIAQAVFPLFGSPRLPIAPSPRVPVCPPLHSPGAMELHISREHRARADSLLADLGVDETELLVGINAGASMRVKRWPVERFAALGRELAARHEARVLLLGGPEDKMRSASLARAIPGAISAAGRTQLGETAALLRRCQLLVSGDTGPLHMAVALGVPCVGLFGPTDPGRYGPWGTAGEGRLRATVLRHAQSCAECRHPCVHTITVDECVAAAEAWLLRSDMPPARIEVRREGAAVAGAAGDAREHR